MSDKEHQETIQEVQRLAQVFHFALTIEGCSLLAKSADVVKSLEDQSRKLEETKQSCESIPGLKDQMIASLAKTSKILQAIQALTAGFKELDKIASGVNDISSAIQEQRILQQRRHDEEERSRVLRWLSTMSFEAKHRQHSELHQNGTSSWFVEDDTFVRWMKGVGSRVLWCSGIPGAGRLI